MPAIVIHESCDRQPGDTYINCTTSLSPHVHAHLQTSSTMLVNMCHGTSIHPASVKAVFEPGKSQKADG